MKPTDSLIHSRLKECFTIQVKKEWKNFIENLQKNKKLNKKFNKFSSFFGFINIEKD